jgi:hypothetical protein
MNRIYQCPSNSATPSNNNITRNDMATVANNKRFLTSLLALLIVFIVMQTLEHRPGVGIISGSGSTNSGNSGNNVVSIQEKTATLRKDYQALIADDDVHHFDAVLMMTEKALDEGFLIMSDDDNDGDAVEEPPRSATRTTPSFCPMKPCDVSMVFMGDSLTRFQYLSLVYFLRHGVWIDPTSVPHLVRPLDYNLQKSWQPWFRASMDALEPNENCDCLRESGQLNATLPFICENRYYHDPVRNNTVTYLQAFGTQSTIHGHWLAQQAIPQLVAYHRTKNQSAIGDTVGPMLGRVPYRWEGTWMDAIRGHVADLAPAVLIMNAGKWKHSFHDPLFQDAIVTALQNVSSVIPRVIWKKTTADLGGKYTYNETDSTMCALLECMDTTWTMDVPQSLYMDQNHFYEPVYRLLNEQLLQQLGIAIPISVSSATNDSSVSWYPERLAIPGLVRPFERR